MNYNKIRMVASLFFIFKRIYLILYFMILHLDYGNFDFKVNLI